MAATSRSWSGVAASDATTASTTPAPTSSMPLPALAISVPPSTPINSPESGELDSRVSALTTSTEALDLVDASSSGSFERAFVEGIDGSVLRRFVDGFKPKLNRAGRPPRYVIAFVGPVSHNLPVLCEKLVEAYPFLKATAVAGVGDKKKIVPEIFRPIKGPLLIHNSGGIFMGDDCIRVNMFVFHRPLVEIVQRFLRTRPEDFCGENLFMNPRQKKDWFIAHVWHNIDPVRSHMPFAGKTELHSQFLAQTHALWLSYVDKIPAFVASRCFIDANVANGKRDFCFKTLDDAISTFLGVVTDNMVKQFSLAFQAFLDQMPLFCYSVTDRNSVTFAQFLTS